jgi:redox-sensitive bicupin YhaK (pirin superfamily)
MSAGTGITHSEFNASKVELVHFLQIWILPERQGLAPSYEQRRFSDAERAGRLRLVASRDGRDGSVRVHQDAAIYAALLAPGEKIVHELVPSRHAWVQVLGGAVELCGSRLAAGDGAAVSGEPRLALGAQSASHVLVFDLA